MITGASGFIGRHLLEGLKERYQIFGIARRSQLRCGAPFHENISWLQVDIGDREPLARAMQVIRDTGPVDVVVHLAAHYDFTGENHPEYWRTNVDGLRNVLEECAELELERFVFASSVAACAFPPRGDALDETSPADGEHIYAVTKRIGEDMLAEYDDRVPSCVVRFAALFSDWCEYPPLYIFLETWLSRAWNSRILGGRGESAIPYLHVREVAPFFEALLRRRFDLEQREVLIASPDHTLGHRDLFDLAHVSHHGRRPKPVLLPAPLCRLGVWGRDLVGRVLGERPFERPWMVKYIDAVLAVDASRTRRRLDWQPRDRLALERRMPFMVEYRKTDPIEWHRRNRAALKEVRMRDNLRLHRLLEKHHDVIRRDFQSGMKDEPGARMFPSYQKVPDPIIEWRFTVILRHLLNAVRTGERGVFTAYCRDLAAKRMEEGFDALEVCNALKLLDRTCHRVLSTDPEAGGLDRAIRDHLKMTIEFGCDQILETYEERGAQVRDWDPGGGLVEPGAPPATPPHP